MSAPMAASLLAQIGQVTKKSQNLTFSGDLFSALRRGVRLFLGGASILVVRKEEFLIRNQEGTMSYIITRPLKDGVVAASLSGSKQDAAQDEELSTLFTNVHLFDGGERKLMSSSTESREFPNM
ncbi:hypothetical protein [uncultured Shimia sp.]|uniref:hypothetical protein n=1 Tax=uncultured Shimia sp. TaxID=573152 RepID=UPI00261E960D|nr:hypothetical protein [uncultured Shimia sp.]